MTNKKQFWHLLAIVATSILGCSLFLLPGMVYEESHGALIPAFLVAALASIPGLLAMAEIISALPHRGGKTFYISRSMGPAVGTIFALAAMSTLCMFCAVMLHGFATTIQYLLQEQFQTVSTHRLIAIEAGVILLILAFVDFDKPVWSYILGLLLTAAVAILFVFNGFHALNFENFKALGGQDFTSIFHGAALMFCSFAGLLVAANRVQKIKAIQKSFAINLSLSLTIGALLALPALLMLIGLLPETQLSGLKTPFPVAMESLAAWTKIPAGLIQITILLILGWVSLHAASGYPVSLSEDNLMPSIFLKKNKHFQTCHLPIFICGVLTICFLFLPIKLAAQSTAVLLFLVLITITLATIILHESRLANYQPDYRVPWYPWLQIIGLGVYLFLFFQTSPEAISVSFCVIIAGLFVYWFYGRIRTVREYALLHIVARLTASELSTTTLENELKQIIRERNQYSIDRFDNLIEEASVLDFNEALTQEELFQKVSETLSPNLNIKSEIILDKLNKREKESPTQISDSLAIPHIVVEGEKVFSIVMARCRNGAYFSESAPNISTVFVLAGSRDERNFHLRALSAIAQIALDPKFEKRWNEARSIEALKDVVLLVERKRFEE